MNPDLPNAEITVLTPLAPPASHTLDPSGATIGRASECTIPIRDRYLSRKHAEIVARNGAWMVRDCGSANGTWLNGTRIDELRPLRSGDRIRLGDSEIVFSTEHPTDRFVAVAESRMTPSISLSVLELTQEASIDAGESYRILNALAMELIEDRPLHELFGFIVDRIMGHLRPSRVAIGLLQPGTDEFASVEVRRADSADRSELEISQTLLHEVVQEKRAIASWDIAGDEKLASAHSIIAQGIRSVLCAPLIIGEEVVGVLYVDYLVTVKRLSEEDVRLIAQIARVAAIKLETTKLREESIQKRLLDEELRTAYLIQRGLLPAQPPSVDGYSFFGLNRPSRGVSGDYYDFVVRPDGSVYFVIADVSGKGITAALLMANLQASFKIFTKGDPTPAELVSQINVHLRENLPRSRFVTLFAGRLDPATGDVAFANGGHVPPLHVSRRGVTELGDTDIILGIADATYTPQQTALAEGDALVLFTDGVTDAENREGEHLETSVLSAALSDAHGLDAAAIAQGIESTVLDYVGDESLGDDLTLMVVCRTPRSDDGDPEDTGMRRIIS